MLVAVGVPVFVAVAGAFVPVTVAGIVVAVNVLVGVLVLVAVAGIGVFVALGPGVLVGALPELIRMRSKSGPQLLTVGLENFSVLLLPTLSVTVVVIDPTVVQPPVTGKLRLMALPPLTLMDALRAPVSPLM